jgi:hypothetical protein
MDIVRPRCAGIDIGKRSLTACVITTDASGTPAKEIRTFGTVTSDLLALADWLDAAGVRAWRWSPPAATGSRSGTCSSPPPAPRSPIRLGAAPAAGGRRGARSTLDGNVRHLSDAG